MNGDFLDRGTTRRRHVYVTHIQHIGKEADDWERRAALGQTDEMQIEYGMSDADLSRVEAQARVVLKDVEDAARSAGIPCDTDMSCFAVPYMGIIDAAERHGCDVIFMASHGRRGLAGLLLGSETQKVLTHSKLPVIVVR